MHSRRHHTPSAPRSWRRSSGGTKRTSESNAAALNSSHPSASHASPSSSLVNSPSAGGAMAYAWPQHALDASAGRARSQQLLARELLDQRLQFLDCLPATQDPFSIPNLRHGIPPTAIPVTQIPSMRLLRWGNEPASPVHTASATMATELSSSSSFACLRPPNPRIGSSSSAALKMGPAQLSPQRGDKSPGREG